MRWNCLTLAMMIAASVCPKLVFGYEKVPAKDALQMQTRQFPLRQGYPYEIFVKKGNGVTTITFPSRITSITGSNVSLDNTGDFNIKITPNSYYFSVTALKDKADGTLTVIYNRIAYILHLVHDPDKAYSVVNFSKGASHLRGANRDNIINETPIVDPGRLISLIDLAKTYDLMAESNQDAIAGVSRQKYDKVYEFKNFKIRLLDVFRFEKEDTVVFKLLLENPSDKEISYDKNTFSVQVGNELHYMSISDASGVMPPHSKSFAFFGITSTPNGGRNNLTVNNNWLIGVTTREMFDHVASFNIPQPPSIEQREKRIKEIAKKLNVKYEELSAKVRELDQKRALLKKEAESERKKLTEAKMAIVKEIQEKDKGTEFSGKNNLSNVGGSNGQSDLSPSPNPDKSGTGKTENPLIAREAPAPKSPEANK